MKKILTLCLTLLLGAGAARADEGMWFLKMMEQQGLAQLLSRAGLQLPTDSLYSETAPSLRETVGIFGAGCTGEIVSADGLVLTNNHCGFDYVHAMSTLEHNYLRDGYFAHSRAEELPVPGLEFTFVERIVDVTPDVMAEAAKAGADIYTAQSQAFLEPLAEAMLRKSDLRGKKGMSVRIVPFFDANRFYLFYEQTYTDVRLVANPPLQVAQFGGNQDNWVWPRQNADFAMFRIYADKKGQPAAPSEKNVPLRRRKFLPVSMQGVGEGDYTMIMGFPGRTSRFLTASEILARTETQNAPVVLAGEEQLRFYKQEMEADEAVRLSLESDYMMRGNVVKNYGGMNEAVRRSHLVDQRRGEEEAFRAWAARPGREAYAGIIGRIDSLMAAVRDTVYDSSLFQATFSQQGYYVSVNALHLLTDALAHGKPAEQKEARAALLQAYDRSAGAARLDVDRRMMGRLLPFWTKYARLDASRTLLPADGAALEAYLDTLYTASAFRSRTTLEAFLDTATAESLAADPFVRHWTAVADYQAGTLMPALTRYQPKRAELRNVYTRGLCEMKGWSKAPDANFTLRLTYGHVCGMEPRDAVSYGWRTTLDGMFEKEVPGDADYAVDENLRKLYEACDFGRYAREDGRMPTCFLSNNDITGGNSGSPVLNARGELIGLAFDGNIESLSSDLEFSPALQRCINVDIRFVLFVLDKLGGCRYVLDEMELR